MKTSYPTVNTKLVVLLGQPLGHSVSPAMHNAAYSELELDYCYLPVEVSSENLAPVFAGLSRMNVAGFNVTIPHKVAILPLLDRIDPLAAGIGAVNTIVVRDGETVGYNTDGEGFLLSLHSELGLTVDNCRALVLGAGGAARAISFTMAARGAAEVVIANRTVEKAEQLATEINTRVRPCARAIAPVGPELEQAAANSRLLINTTSIGMSPGTDQSPLPAELLHPALAVADIVYNPRRTRLLTLAAETGCQTLAGLGMLIHQGAAAIRLWTGLEPPIVTMWQAAENRLGEK